MRDMRTEAPPSVPIFRSALQARLLLHVLTSDEGVTAAEGRVGSEPPSRPYPVRPAGCRTLACCGGGTSGGLSCCGRRRTIPRRPRCASCWW